MKKPIEKLKNGPIPLDDMLDKINEILDYLFPEEGGENPYPDSEQKIRNNRIMNEFLGDRADSSKIIYSPEPSAEWEERFDIQFKGITLGTLSGEKGSPIFHNNELEVPRLKNFIRSEKEASCQQGREEMKVELRRDVAKYSYQGYGHFDKGYNTAVSEIENLLS